MDYVREPFGGIFPLETIQGLGKADQQQKKDKTAEAAPKETPTSTPAAKQRNGVTLTGVPADKVVINPDRDQVQEAAEKEVHAAMAFGRMNPPTVGHEKLIHKVEAVAKEHKGSSHIIASHSEGNTKNPIPQKAKLGYLKKVASKTTHVTGSSKEHPTFLQHAAELHKQGVTHLHMVAGSDRVKEYHEKLHKYNGSHEGALYNFKKITVHDAGHRDPDAEGSEGMSGTKMRALAHAGKKKEFKAGLPKALHPHAEEIAGHVRSIKEETLMELSTGLLDRYKAKAKASADQLSDQGKYKKSTDRWSNVMKATGKQIDKTTASIKSSVKEDLDETASMQTRMHRSQVMRRNAKKLANARKLSRDRTAKKAGLRRRALKKARTILRDRILGPRGANYSKLGLSDKMAFDRLTDKREKQVVSMANTIAPKIRRNDILRLSSISHGKKVRNLKMPIVASYEVDVANTLTEKAAFALREKAAKSGISFDTIVEVFARGIENYPQDSKLTPQQYAFGRVNSFLSQGKAFNEDADLTRKDVKYTARNMAQTDVEQLPKMLPFNQYKKTKGDIESTKDSLVSQRKKADLVRRAAGEMKRKVMESKGTVYQRAANKIVRAKSPQLANMKKGLVDALKKKDYDSVANMIMYLVRDKLGNNTRLKQEDVCTPEEDYIYEEYTEQQWNTLVEENNEGRALNKPFRTPGGPKKFAVYVKNDKGNIIKLGFGDPNLEIKRDDPERRKAYRARHGCDNPGPRWKANWWSCNWSWSSSKKVGA